MKKKIENKNQEVLTYAERSQAMSKEAQAEKIEDILKRYDSAEAKIKDMKSVTIEAANECRAVGIELQALCGHEQINFEFWKNNCAKLNKKFDLNNAKIFIAIARKMPKSAKTIAEAAPLTQLIYQAVDLLQIVKRQKVADGMCDCGNPATLRDGSGRFCADCYNFVQRCHRIIHSLIVEQRAEVEFDQRIERKQLKYLRRKLSHQ